MKAPWLKLNQFTDALSGGGAGEEGEKQDAQQQQAIDINRAMSGWQERTLRKVDEILSKRFESVVTRDDLDTLVERITEARETTKPNDDGGRAKKTKDDSEKQAVETPLDVELAKLRDELDTERKKREESEARLLEEKESIDLDRFHSSVEETLVKNGANPQLARQARIAMLADAKIHKDSERGRLFEMEGKYGEEYVSAQDYVDQWLPTNTHFLNAQKQGSGASNSNVSGGVPGKSVDFSKLATQEGVDAYLADPDAARASIEAARTGDG